jgi:choloylglycine hydrolase
MTRLNRTSRAFRLVAATTAMTFLASTTASACTGILLKNADGTIVHGRTLEFGVRW